MADVTGLPSMPTTVNLDGGDLLQGDPLELMRAEARKSIDSVNKNALPNEKEKIEFKKYVLKKLQGNIKKFEEIDADASAQKQDNQNDVGEGESQEEDPFADIFNEEEAGADETMQEKMKVAQEFISDLKIAKEKFLKEVRIKREKEQAQKDENKLKEILGKLNEV